MDGRCLLIKSVAGLSRKRQHCFDDGFALREALLRRLAHPIHAYRGGLKRALGAFELLLLWGRAELMPLRDPYS
jgi:hypothetical protein